MPLNQGCDESYIGARESVQRLRAQTEPSLFERYETEAGGIQQETRPEYYALRFHRVALDSTFAISNDREVASRWCVLDAVYRPIGPIKARKSQRVSCPSAWLSAKREVAKINGNSGSRGKKNFVAEKVLLGRRKFVIAPVAEIRVEPSRK